MFIFRKILIFTSLIIFLLVTSTAFKSVSTNYSEETLKKQLAIPTGLIRIQNRWKSNQYIHIEHGSLEANPIHAEAWSAMWTFEKVSGTNFYRIKNRWKSNQYIHIEHGSLEASPIHAGAWSAMWYVEQVQGTNFYRIRNRWKSNQYINVEHGSLEASPIHAGAWSAMWTLKHTNTVIKPNIKKN